MGLVFICIFALLATLLLRPPVAYGASLDATAKRLYIQFEQIRSQEAVPSDKTKSLAQDLVPLLLNAGKAQEAIWVLNRAGEPQVAAQLENAIINELKYGKIVDAGPIRHTGSGPAFVRLESGLIALAKAELRSSSPQSVHAEYWTYLVSKSLGLNVAPITVLRKIDGYLFSLQIFIPEAKESGRDFRINHEIDVPWLWALDRLTGQMDRNAANSLVTMSGHYVGIDNEQAANFSPKDPVMAMQTWQAELRSSTPEQTSLFSQLFRDPQALTPEFKYWAAYIAPEKMSQLPEQTSKLWSPEIQSALQARVDEFLRSVRSIKDVAFIVDPTQTRFPWDAKSLQTLLENGLTKLDTANLMVPTTEQQMVEFILPETKLKALIRAQDQTGIAEYIRTVNLADNVWLLQLPIQKMADLISAFVDDNPKAIELLDLMYENEVWYEELVRLDPRFKARLEKDSKLLEKVTKVMMLNWRRAPQFLGRFLMPPSPLSAEKVEYIFQQFAKNQLYMQIEMLLRIPHLKTNSTKYASSFQLLAAEIKKRKLKSDVLQIPEWAIPTLNQVVQIRCELVLK